MVTVPNAMPDPDGPAEIDSETFDPFSTRVPAPGDWVTTSPGGIEREETFRISDGLNPAASNATTACAWLMAIKSGTVSVAVVCAW